MKKYLVTYWKTKNDNKEIFLAELEGATIVIALSSFTQKYPFVDIIEVTAVPLELDKSCHNFRCNFQKEDNTCMANVSNYVFCNNKIK